MTEKPSDDRETRHCGRPRILCVLKGKRAVPLGTILLADLLEICAARDQFCTLILAERQNPASNELRPFASLALGDAQEFLGKLPRHPRVGIDDMIGCLPIKD